MHTTTPDSSKFAGGSLAPPNGGPSEWKELGATVIGGGYCIGCGACAAVEGSPFSIREDDCGRYAATLDGNKCSKADSAQVLEVCPFSGRSPNEDQIGEWLFSALPRRDAYLGFHLSVYAGHVEENGFRARGSSGGMGSWILTELMAAGLVDRVAHVHQTDPAESGGRLFEYRVSSTADEVVKNAKSRYYPVELSQIMEEIRRVPGRYAIVGIPCFIKAVRLLCRRDPVLRERIRVCVGLVCGHLKSRGFAEMLAWQAGVPPENLRAINFRKKLPGRPANEYGIEAAGEVNGTVETFVKPMGELHGNDWGMGYFKYKACDFCDDVMAECSDVTIGDAWLPRYVKDSAGTNIAVVRSAEVDALLKAAAGEGRLRLDVLTADEARQSQGGGFRHRREGLAYRLHKLGLAGVWHPPKRVRPGAAALSPARRRIQDLRSALAEQSHVQFLAAKRSGGGPAEFKRRMLRWVLPYMILVKATKLADKIAARLRRSKPETL